MGRPIKKSFLRLIYLHANVDGINIDAVESSTLKQAGSRRYRVTTDNGTEVCQLVASDTPTKGQMYIVSRDSAGNTYWVVKLTRHKATVVQRTLVEDSTYQFESNQAVAHNFGASPVPGVSVSIEYD